MIETAKKNGKAGRSGGWVDAPGRSQLNEAHAKAMEDNAERANQTLVLPALSIKTIKVNIEGDSELICHKWSTKAMTEILQKQMKIAKQGREQKDPIEDFLASMYILQAGKVKGAVKEIRKGDLTALSDDGHPNIWMEGGEYGFPTIAFKSAMVEACTSLGKSITKVAARQAFHVNGELVEIVGRPRMRCDMVRLGGLTSDIRFRGGFPTWETTLTIRYNSRVLSADQLVNMLNTAGFACGIGEWRAQRDGGFGMFHVK